MAKRRILPRDFYDRPTLAVARDLIGKVLVHRRGTTVTSGMIVEVEAYIGESDPACHAAPGRTARNALMYGEAGYAYVYLNYGIHCLVNVVTESIDAPAAVLIRSLAPLDGIDMMRRRRAKRVKGRRVPSGKARAARSTSDLCRGPGNLTMALGITLEQNGLDLVASDLFIEDRGFGPHEIVWGPRVGINVGTERPWRAFVAGHPAVSGKPVSAPPAGGRAPASAAL